MFHISLLRPYFHRPGEPIANIAEPELAPDGTEVWEVEKILAERKHKGGQQYLLQWKGYNEDNATWEPAENLKRCTISWKPGNHGADRPTDRQEAEKNELIEYENTFNLPTIYFLHVWRRFRRFGEVDMNELIEYTNTFNLPTICFLRAPKLPSSAGATSTSSVALRPALCCAHHACACSGSFSRA